MSGVGTTAVGGIVGHGVAVGASIAEDALPHAAKIAPNMQKHITFARNFMLFHPSFRAGICLRRGKEANPCQLSLPAL
jgi:hypothetical protein